MPVNFHLSRNGLWPCDSLRNLLSILTTADFYNTKNKKRDTKRKTSVIGGMVCRSTVLLHGNNQNASKPSARMILVHADR